jgi:hypothetical protein
MTHCDLGPDVCFGCKCAYWRDGAGAPLKFTYGRNDFHGPTVREREREAIADARRQGIEPERF